MPGPPREMKPMWYHQILPRLRQIVTGAIIVSKTFKTFGLTEASVGELVSPLLSSANPTLGVYAKADGIHLRLTAKAQNRKQAEEMIAHGEVRLRSIVGEYIWGTDDDALEAAVGRMLTEKGLSLAVMESYSGGLLAATITGAPGAATYFKGGVVAGSDEALGAFGVDAKVISGASRAEVAQAMAGAARLHLGADIGVSVAGVEEPNEVEERLVTTVYIGIDDGKDRRAITARYPWDRVWVKRRAVTAALFELRKMLASA
jgi:nicotinamide-nucleotide amidase